MLSASGREKSLAGPRARGGTSWSCRFRVWMEKCITCFFGEVPADGRCYCRGRMADGVGLNGIWTGVDPSAGRGLPEAMSSCHDVAAGVMPGPA